MYGKLENGKMIFAPNFLIIDNMKVWNANAEEHIKQGWFPLIFTEEPTTDEHHYTVQTWEQNGNEIIQVWHIEEIEVTADELLNIIMGEE